MKTDRELQEQVLAALEWEPGVDVAGIGVTAEAGVVTLHGSVTTYHEKFTAERTARRVYGVRAVANDVEVKPTESTKRSDSEIAKAVADAIERDSAVPRGVVKATVTDGWVTLSGDVMWQFQRMAAEAALRHLFGVKGIINSIVVKPHVRVSEVKHKIEEAFRRSADVDSRRVTVEAKGDTVILSGQVHSLTERDAAERAAWAAPGVAKVEDHLVVAV